MRFVSVFSLVVLLFVSTGFSQSTAKQETKTKGSMAKTTTSMAKATPVKIESGKIKLSPENSKIAFIGTHVGATPDPKARHGGFGKFDGMVEMSDDGKMVKSFALNIDTTSVTTPMAKLTGHLKAGDFFNVEKYATAKFMSTKIEATDKPDMYKITGNMEMLGKKKELTIPAMVKVTDEGMMLKSNFMLDRTKFGMPKMSQKVNKKVAVEFVVGEKTAMVGKKTGSMSRGARGGSAKKAGSAKK